MGDKGEGAVKNLKKWVMSFMDGLSSRSVAVFEFAASIVGDVLQFIL